MCDRLERQKFVAPCVYGITILLVVKPVLRQRFFSPTLKLPSTSSTSLRKPATIYSDDLIRNIRRLHHPYNGFCDFIRAAIATQRYPCVPNISNRNGDLRSSASRLLFANSRSSPGSILVSPINAGAIPFTVIPFFAYAPASQ